MRHFCQYFALFVIAVLAARALPATAQEKKVDAAKSKAPAISAEDRVPEDVRLLMQNRQYKQAVAAIVKAEKVKDAPVDYLIYLRGQAQHLLKQYDAAVASFVEIEKKFPKSPWARRARFAQAVSYMRKGDFRKAELIYRGEVTYLLSEDRKQQIADIYLEFADSYFKPAEETKKPDYNKALQFYTKALQVGPKPKRRVEVELRVARCYQLLRNFAEAARRYDIFVKQHTKSDLASAELLVEARFRLGESRLALGQHAAARRSWEDLLAAHGDSKSERIAEATYNLGKTYRMPAPASDDDLTLGVTALRAFLKKYPEHKLASVAHLDVARGYINRGRYDDAVTALGVFLEDERYAQRDEVPQARYLLGRGYQLQKKYDEALAAWAEYLTKHPSHKNWADAQREIVNTEYLRGDEQRRAKNYAKARNLWTAFLAKYPLDGRSRSILYLFGQMNYEQEKWDAAIADWRRLVSKYPGTNESSQAQYMVGITIEEELHKLEEALKEYRKVTWGSQVGNARRRIAQLTAKSMSIATTRVFRSDETPHLTLTSRNIEEVSVRIYTVDLETYFRKMHLARGVEKLDISLIGPDKTLTFKVPKYAQYQELESKISIPLPQMGDIKAPKSGVLAVTVSSKTLEATTMLVQSDLDVIVKSSRDEVFVFAQNMRTGKPWPKARLLISNGSQVFAEETTGDDGVFQKAYKELKSAGDVRVFVIGGGSVASNVVGLSGVGVAQGLSEKGYIYTDRPAYRAGQVAHIRGVIRQVQGDTYTVSAGKKYTLEVFDSRNRQLRKQEVTLSDFGGFHTHLLLPTTSPPGNYRVILRDEKTNKSFQGSFTVHEYQTQPVRLVIDVDRKVFYRGEEIEGTITASYYYGAPLAGREIRYRLAGGRIETAKTDAKGQVKFKLATREFRQDQVLPLVVQLPERNLATSVNFFLSSKGYSIAVTAARPVYVSGETFDVSVTTTSAEGKPVGRQLTLKVLEQTTVAGKVGERLVEDHEITTDEKTGRGNVTLRLEKGARYILRAEGSDRFENTISGQHVVRVSDDSDNVRLRILADKHTFKVGDTAAVQLHWREKPALALVTYQGARVLQYKLVTLQKGANKLAIPMTAKLAPNFELSVAVMTDVRDKEAAAKKKAKIVVRRFHVAQSGFSVQRDLRVSIVQARADKKKGPLRPGDEMELTITTTDPQGKPVSAEVSLAMVEQSLLAIFPSNLTPIDQFFRGQQRQTAVRTTSSATFDYRPKTKPINARLLAEVDRLVLKAEEATRLAAVDPGDPSSGGSFASRTKVETGVRDSVNFANALAEKREQMFDQQGQPSDRQSDSLPGNRKGQSGKSGDAKRPIFQRGSGRGGQVAGGAESWGQSRGDAADLYFRGHLGTKFKSLDKSENDEDREAGWSYLPPTTANLSKLRFDNGRVLTVVTRDGRQWNINRGEGKWDDEKEKKLSEELTEKGAVLLPEAAVAETGYWNPAIVTDKDGKATVRFHLPETSTAWKLLAKGISLETLAGEATGELTVKKDLFGEMKLPLAFTDGDDAIVPVSIHNTGIKKGKINVTLKTTIGGKTVTQTKQVDAAEGISQLSFKVALRRPEEDPKADDKAPVRGNPNITATFELTIAAGDAKDVVRRNIPVRPYGAPVYVTAGGAATGDTTVWVESPKDMPISAPALQILIGPTVERSLLDVLFAPAPWCQVETLNYASGLERSTSDLMAALALQKLIGATREASGPQSQSIDSRVRSSISQLVSAQRNDGGWSWTGRGGASNRYSTARVVWALSLARKSGYVVPDSAWNGGRGFLQNQIAATSNTDYESKAILLHALSAAGSGDFTLANRLFRNRQALSSAAVAHLALAFADMDRKETAAELLKILAQRDLDMPLADVKAGRKVLPWSHAPVELRSLYALAVQKVSPGAPEAKKLVDWLMAHRTGHRWSPEKSTGPAMLAVCQWFSTNRFKGEHYKLSVFVNDFRVKVLDIKDGAGTITINVPPTFFRKKGKQRINFQVAGRGRYSFQCIYGGFVAADKLKSTTTAWRVARHYQPAPLELDGKEIPRGFGGVLSGSYKSFRNPLTQLPVGRRGQVELIVNRANTGSTIRDEQFEYLVITEPLPAGTTVIKNSVKGAFDRWETTPGAITFYVGSRRHIGTIRFDVHGYTPGSYKTAPTLLRNAYRPEQLAVSTIKTLVVLPSGAKSEDKYRLSPQELYELGKRHFAKKNYATAGKHLGQLLADWSLKANIYKETARMLLDVHVERGPANEVVRYFEIIKEKWPSLQIPFDKIVKIAAAYHEIGEYERSFLIFRATVESSFQRESGVGGFLESQGEFNRSVNFMTKLLQEYPPEPYVAAATYALAQRVYAKAPEAAGDVKLREQKVHRVDLVRQALRMLDNFLTAYPADPAADQAGFSIANALLELKSYKRAIAQCERYAKLYANSDFLDSYWYVIGYCHFALGNHKEALAMCRKVAEHKRTDKASGRQVDSLNKWRAIYILAQVYHSLDKAAEAIVQYTRVQQRFTDAKQAIAYFARKEIKLPEVTTIRPGEKGELTLDFRNVPKCDIKVYRIDLMKFSLLRRNLKGITKINLAGIRPHHESLVELGDGKDYRDRKKKLNLPFKEEGAYLVVCRGGNLHTSGLVLVTPLEIEVQEDATSGRVRTTIKDKMADRYITDAHVKVIGSANGDFVSGETDLRGVFVADAIRGTTTVIAQVDQSRYAFFRGKTHLGPAPSQNRSRSPAPAKKPSGSKVDKLLDGLKGFNKKLQREQQKELQDLYKNDAKGVKADKAF